MIILDSSAIIHLLNATQQGNKIKEILQKDSYAATTISINEVLIGTMQKERSSVIEFFKSIELFPFNSDAAFRSIEVEEALRKKGKPINKLDVLIASICLVNECQIITTDKDFKNIDNLKTILI